MKRAHLAFLACAAIFALAAAPVARAEYTFTLIADTTSPTFNSFNILSVAINASGRVAFAAQLDNFDNGIFTGAGGPTTTIALASGPTFSYFAAPVIDSAGNAVFFAGLDAGRTGNFYGSGGPTTTIALDADHGGSLGQPAVNAAGTAVFTGGLLGNQGIFTVTNGTKTTVASTGGAPFSSFAEKPSINATGTVAFEAALDAGGEGIFTKAGGVTTTIALSSSPLYSDFAPPVVNAGGTVAFSAILDDGGRGLYTSTGGVVTTIADTSGPFNGVGGVPAINAAGIVAFSGSLDAGGYGIYLGDGGAPPTRVFGTGDALFGSTITQLIFGPAGFNDAGQLAFNYTLANGVQGIAVATPTPPVPEPTSALLLAASGFTLLLRRRARP